MAPGGVKWAVIIPIVVALLILAFVLFFLNAPYLWHY